MEQMMSAAIGCVLAIQNRPVKTLERTFQTYAYQTLSPQDRVLLDYGSRSAEADAYKGACQRYGWRYVAVVPCEPGWCLSAAYNAAVSALKEGIEVVFKNDVDVLLGNNVLALAAEHGHDRLAIFSSCLAAPEATAYPPIIKSHQDLLSLISSSPPPEWMDTEGLNAFPREWFERIGGFDLEFRSWGYEDSDLRERAKATIGVIEVGSALLLHQWHPRHERVEEARKNRAYYDRMKNGGNVVRNGGPLRSQDETKEPIPRLAAVPQEVVPSSVRLPRLAFATRSMNGQLFALSGELLGLDQLVPGTPCDRVCIRNTGSIDYFRRLLEVDADWVINIDEDAFVLNPALLLELIRYMEDHRYAACGMPDGGVVRIRRHNPVACNALFNVFDLRRVRPAWKDWNSVTAAVHKPEFEGGVADFAARSTFAFDHFERYYGVFFSLLNAGERILYLDAEEWEDSVSTLLKDAVGNPLLIHCWYTRNWTCSYHTRKRYRAAIDCARRSQGLGPILLEKADLIRALPISAESNVGKWSEVYEQAQGPRPYGDTLTYEKAAQFLACLATVEDWGCGWSWFRNHLPPTVSYKGIDGSKSPFVGEVADLTKYSSQAEGILLRHVLEHNQAWPSILRNAIRSFTKRMVLVLFTPFSDVTHEIGYNAAMKIPDISFAKTDLIRFFTGVTWSLEENLRTNTQYGIEHVFYLEKR